MITDCSCPAAASLTDIPVVKCAEGFGQIQKIAFQRLTDDAGAKTGFKAAAAITKKASWTALIAATDSTKIVISPIVENPTSEPGEARTTGGGNDTPGGIEKVIGTQPTSFTGVFRNIPQSVIKVMKKLQCEAASRNLGVYLFDEAGNIEAIADPDTDGNYYPIPIRSLFISDKGHGGLEAEDSNNISWSFEPNYSDDLKIIVPEDFNALDLAPAASGD